MMSKRKFKILFCITLICSLTLGNVITASASTSSVLTTVNVKKTDGSYYATMSLTRNSYNDVVSNGKYVNSGKTNTVSDPGSWNHLSHTITWQKTDYIYQMQVTGLFLFFMEDTSHSQEITKTFYNYK